MRQLTNYWYIEFTDEDEPQYPIEGEVLNKGH